MSLSFLALSLSTPSLIELLSGSLLTVDSLAPLDYTPLSDLVNLMKGKVLKLSRSVCHLDHVVVSFEAISIYGTAAAVLRQDLKSFLARGT